MACCIHATYWKRGGCLPLFKLVFCINLEYSFQVPCQLHLTRRLLHRNDADDGEVGEDGDGDGDGDGEDKNKDEDEFDE